MTTKHFMLDIETLSTAKNAVVLSVSCTEFDPYVVQTVEEVTANRSIHLYLKPQAGRDIDQETVLWWFQQSRRAIQKQAAAKRYYPRVALMKLHDFMVTGSPTCIKVWAQSPDFDCAIMDDLHKWVMASSTPLDGPYDQLPWNFWNQRCTRTLYDNAGGRPRGLNFPGISHDAQFDTWVQISQVQQAFLALGQSRAGTVTATLPHGWSHIGAKEGS